MAARNVLRLFLTTISKYRVAPRPMSPLKCGAITTQSLRLYLTSQIPKKDPIKDKTPAIVLALSILSWLGFTEEDEEKESELIMTLKRAVLCKNREQYQKAEQMLHLALRLAQQQQNEQGVLYCYDLMANLAFDTFELDKANKLFVAVLQMLLTNGIKEDDLKVIHISLKLARIAQLKADLEKADLGYKWCMDRIEKQKNNNIDSQMLYGVIQDWYAQFLLDKGEVKESIRHLKQAYDACLTTQGSGNEQSMLLLNDLGTTSFRAGDMENAQNYLKQAISVGKDLDDKSHLGVVHANLGLIVLENGLAQEAEKYCKEAWRLGLFFFCEVVLIREISFANRIRALEIYQKNYLNIIIAGKRHEDNETIEHANYCFDQIRLSLGK